MNPTSTEAFMGVNLAAEGLFFRAFRGNSRVTDEDNSPVTREKQAIKRRNLCFFLIISSLHTILT